MYVEMLSSCVPRNGSMPLFSVSIINLAFGQDGWPMQVPFFACLWNETGLKSTEVVFRHILFQNVARTNTIKIVIYPKSYTTQI